MKNLFLLVLIIINSGCYSNTYGQNKDSIKGNQLEKLEKILIDGEYEFNAYNLVRNERNDGNESKNYYFDPITFELIDLTKNKNKNIPQSVSRENMLPRSVYKKLDSLVLYKIIKKDSIIFLTTENKNFPNFTIKLISNQLELIDSGYILNLEKEIIVKDNNNILKSGWAGFRWQKDIYNTGIKYGHSVTIGRTYDFNKIYIEIKIFINTKKINMFLISV